MNISHPEKETRVDQEDDGERERETILEAGI
jgi:hypothetical protein